MLYVFHVDNGSMMTFNMDLALTNVQKLKEVICEKVSIPVEKQVLLISGGEALLNSEDVCHYSAGTDTNPIFLFNLAAIENFDRCSHLQSDYVEDPVIKSTDTDIKEQIESSSRLLPGQTTMLSRVRLSQYIFEVSRDQLSLCEESVLHQHLQQQGWAAVVANLEDILVAIEKKFEVFDRNFQLFLKSREERKDLLDHFEQDIILLKRIPLLPALSRHGGKTIGASIETTDTQTHPHPHPHLEASCESPDDVLAINESLCESSRHTSLLDWIDAKDIETLLENCRTKLSKFDCRLLKQLQAEFSSIAFEGHEKPEFKEIKGLGERLSHLDTLMRDGRKVVEEQKILAESFLHSKSRSATAGGGGGGKDESMYRNLCQSQVQYLRQMHANYTKISDIRRRCTRAKFELSSNIIRRLNWIVFVEHRVTELDGNLVIYGENVRRLESELRVFEQIHLAPQLYFNAISEVVRRHLFSKQFVTWANRLSCESKEIYEEEVLTRKQFTAQFSSHFLNSLFPGLSDCPPAFATEQPRSFDQSLPKLSQSSLDALCDCVPELSHLLVHVSTWAIPSIIRTEALGGEVTQEGMRSLGVAKGEKGRGDVFASAADVISGDSDDTVGGGGGGGSDSKKGGFGGERLHFDFHNRRSRRTSRPLSFRKETENDLEDFEKVFSMTSEEGEEGGSSYLSSTEEEIVSRGCGKGRLIMSSFPPSDSSKHIKLDSSQQGPLQLPSQLTMEQQSSLSREDLEKVERQNFDDSCLRRSSSQTSPDEFLSPDFLISESGSVPGPFDPRSRIPPCLHCAKTPVAFSNVAPPPPPPAGENDNNETSSDMAELQNELLESRGKIEVLRSRLNALANLNYDKVIKDIRTEMESLKDQVREDSGSYLSYITDVSTRLLEVLEKIHRESEVSKESAIQAALTLAANDQGVHQRNLTLEAQLTDASRELDMYQDQIRGHLTTIERLHCEMDEDKILLQAEKEESVKKLTLEHELELDALKEQWRKEEVLRSEEMSTLLKKLCDVEQLLAKSGSEKASLEKELEKKFEAKCREKEESICQILGASFSEREKRNLETQKKELQKDFDERKNELATQHQQELLDQLEQLRRSLEEDYEQRIQTELKHREQKHAEELRRCSDLWEAQKEEELEAAKEVLRNMIRSECDLKCEALKKQYKMDLEGLRSRFRMMTTASMERSPSETSLEKFERGDYVETTFHELSLAKLRDELTRDKTRAVEETSIQLRREHSELLSREILKMERVKKEDMRRLVEQKQEQLDEALQEMSRDKESVIEDLRRRVEFLTEENERLTTSQGNTTPSSVVDMSSIDSSKNTTEGGTGQTGPESEFLKLQEQCTLYKGRIERLERELERAKRLSFVSERNPTEIGATTSTTNTTTTAPQEDMTPTISPTTSSSCCLDPTNTGPTTFRAPAEYVSRLQLENKDLKVALTRLSNDRRRIAMDDAQIHDFVLVVWDELYSQYRVLLESHKYLHFLHCDSYAPLGLTKGCGRPDKLFCVAQVTRKKEFCQAKRDRNRFRVPKGTKFFRVPVGPAKPLDVGSPSPSGDAPLIPPSLTPVVSSSPQQEDSEEGSTVSSV